MTEVIANDDGTVTVDGVVWNWCGCGDCTHNADSRCDACRDVDAVLGGTP